MALVRRPTAVGHAAVHFGAPAIPAQPAATAAIPNGAATSNGVATSNGAPAPDSATSENAAAVPTLPAQPWAVFAGLGLVVAGGLGAMAISDLSPTEAFQVGNQMSAFAALFVFAAAVERLLEPVSRWMPGHKPQAGYERALADMTNGVPGAVRAVAHFKAAVERARSSRGVLMWGLATAVSTVLAAAGGFYLLRMISANPSWDALPQWVDALVTGLVVGSGTKPLHDLISRVQKQKEGAAEAA